MPYGKGLGRRPPTDWRHVERYSLTTDTAPTKPTPVAIGINWYHAFDQPQQDRTGAWWIARTGSLGNIRGGHCVCLKPRGVNDTTSWWRRYDQGSEGACVGYGCSRMMSLLNRRYYDAPWLYHEAQLVDEWTDTPPAEGTSVRAALDILRTRGHRYYYAGKPKPENPADGISANRWARTAGEALDVLGTPELDYVTLLNSWGVSYPHTVRMPASVLQRLIDEDGEVGLVVDR
jgi:hypothetical protein